MAKEERATEVMEELAGLLTAISIVSKRLAANLKKLNDGNAKNGKAGDENV